MCKNLIFMCTTSSAKLLETLNRCLTSAPTRQRSSAKLFITTLSGPSVYPGPVTYWLTRQTSSSTQSRNDLMPQNTVNGFTSDRFEAVREVFDKRSCVKYLESDKFSGRFRFDFA